MSGMNCQDFEIAILSMAQAQWLEPAVRRQTLAHIVQCPACADKLAEQQAVSAAIRATIKSFREEGASAHVEQSLRAAFRKQSPARSTRRQKFALSRQWLKPAAFAAATVILFTILAGMIWKWPSISEPRETATKPPLPSTTIPKKTEDAAGMVPASGPPVRQIINERPRTRRILQRNAASKDEVTTDFLVLADESELAPLESGQVLRVQLSASTLISMGLPITTEDVSKSVLADLLIGQDGMARAIRLIQPSEASGAGSHQQSTNK